MWAFRVWAISSVIFALGNASGKYLRAWIIVRDWLASTAHTRHDMLWYLVSFRHKITRKKYCLEPHALFAICYIACFCLVLSFKCRPKFKFYSNNRPLKLWTKASQTRGSRTTSWYFKLFFRAFYILIKTQNA